MPVTESDRENVLPSEVAALVVTYLPDAELHARISALLEQFDRVALIDNGSADEYLEPLSACVDIAGVTLHRNPINKGIATALNQGMAILAAEGFCWVVTFDQDSSIQPGFLRSILQSLNAQPRPTQVALVGSNRKDPGCDIPHRWLRARDAFPYFERVGCAEATAGVTLVITSGTLTNLSVLKRLGGFWDELFIDLVDFEYCLRARQQGYAILVSCAAQLIHKVGQQTRRGAMGLVLSSTHHSPLRRYYLFRNSIHLIRRHGRVHPHWLTYQMLALCEVVLGIAVTESGKWRKLQACFAGIRDGLSGMMGPCRRNWGHPTPDANRSRVKANCTVEATRPPSA